MEAESELAIWLLPAEPERSSLGTVIARLARQWDTPEFEPHVTVISGIRLPAGRAMTLLAEATGETASFRLAPAALAHTPARFQCLFLTFADPRPVLELRARLVPAFGLLGVAFPEPHLSLLYAVLAEEARQLAAAQVTMPGPFLAAELALVAPAAGESSWANVRGWRILERFPLHEAELP